MLNGGSLVACNASVVAIVHQCEIGDAQGAGEVYVVYGDTQAGRDWPAILLPGDEDWLVARHDHAGDENSLADGKPRKLKWVDGRWNCGGDMHINFTLGVLPQAYGFYAYISSLTSANISHNHHSPFMCV